MIQLIMFVMFGVAAGFLFLILWHRSVIKACRWSYFAWIVSISIIIVTVLLPICMTGNSLRPLMFGLSVGMNAINGSGGLFFIRVLIIGIILLAFSVIVNHNKVKRRMIAYLCGIIGLILVIVDCLGVGYATGISECWESESLMTIDLTIRELNHLRNDKISEFRDISRQIEFKEHMLDSLILSSFENISPKKQKVYGWIFQRDNCQLRSSIGEEVARYRRKYPSQNPNLRIREREESALKRLGKQD